MNSTPTPQPTSAPPTQPAPNSRLLMLRAAVTGAVSGTTRALVLWFLEQH